MRALVPSQAVDVTIDMAAHDTLQVEVQREAALPGMFKLYVHEHGQTTLRICKIPQHMISLPDSHTPPPPDRADERDVTKHKFKAYDWPKLEQEFKDATGGLPNYKRLAAYEYINALKNEIFRLDTELGQIRLYNAEERRKEREAHVPQSKHSDPEIDS